MHYQVAPAPLGISAAHGYGAIWMIQPQRPKEMSRFAQACLDALATSKLAPYLSLGGAFGLAHYFEYRSTHDVDAWWVEPVTSEVRRRVARVLVETLQPYGEVRTRAWGDVVSIELLQAGKVVFSFQIALRSAQLQDLLPAPWPTGMWLDTFEDLVASKMTALVERGAPRDFRDIYMLCQAQQCSIGQCWELWQARQLLANENADAERANLAIHTHLARIERARPLEQIADPQQHMAAEQLRKWFLERFLHGFEN